MQWYYTFIHLQSPRPLSISSLHLCSVGKTSLWCRAENRTRACLPASRRATNWATPHLWNPQTWGGTTWTGDLKCREVKLDFAEINKCKRVFLRLLLAGNLKKPLMFHYGTEWRERGYGLWCSVSIYYLCGNQRRELIFINFKLLYLEQICWCFLLLRLGFFLSDVSFHHR